MNSDHNSKAVNPDPSFHPSVLIKLYIGTFVSGLCPMGIKKKELSEFPCPRVYFRTDQDKKEIQTRYENLGMKL